MVFTSVQSGHNALVLRHGGSVVSLVPCVQRVAGYKILRSSKLSDVFVPGTKTKMGDWVFQVAGPRTWNSLPSAIWETKTLPAFKKTVDTLTDR